MYISVLDYGKNAVAFFHTEMDGDYEDLLVACGYSKSQIDATIMYMISEEKPDIAGEIKEV